MRRHRSTSPIGANAMAVLNTAAESGTQLASSCSSTSPIFSIALPGGCKQLPLLLPLHTLPTFLSVLVAFSDVLSKDSPPGAPPRVPPRLHQVRPSHTMQKKSSGNPWVFTCICAFKKDDLKKGSRNVQKCQKCHSLLRVPSTEGRSVCLCWEHSKPKGPTGPIGSVDPIPPKPVLRLRRLLHTRISSGGILWNQTDRGKTWTFHSPGNGTGSVITAKPLQ